MRVEKGDISRKSGNRSKWGRSTPGKEGRKTGSQHSTTAAGNTVSGGKLEEPETTINRKSEAGGPQ